jgi:hypothetical protein
MTLENDAILAHLRRERLTERLQGLGVKTVHPDLSDDRLEYIATRLGRLQENLTCHIMVKSSRLAIKRWHYIAEFGSDAGFSKRNQK